MAEMIRRVAGAALASAMAGCFLFPSLDEYEARDPTSSSAVDASPLSEGGTRACSNPASVCDDFESDPVGWLETGSPPTRTASVTPAPPGGASVLHASGDLSASSYRERSIEGRSSGAFAFRFRALVSRAPGSGASDYADLATVRNKNGARILVRFEHEGRWKVLMSNSTESGKSIDAPGALNRWTCVEVDTLLGDASLGSVRLFVDGVSSGASSFATFASSSDIYDQLRLGVLQVSEGAFDAYFDDFIYAPFDASSLSNTPLIGCD